MVNPYTPGAGVRPSYLAGRDNLIKGAEKTLQSIKAGVHSQSYMYYGLRGVGKTVLLNEIEECADSLGFIYEHIEISENDDFKKVIYMILKKFLVELRTIHKVKETAMKGLALLKAFTISYCDVEFGLDVEALEGKADTGHFQNDLTELFLQLGRTAKESGKNLAIFIDEVQYLKNDDFEALIAAIHRIGQKNYPIIVFGAGLPKIAKIAGDAKSYAERLFDYVKIDSLKPPHDEEAIVEPARKFNKQYTPEAISKVLAETEGYPYFIQEFGRIIWERTKSDTIDLEIVNNSYNTFIQKLDEGFFKVRYDRATDGEKEFMKAMGSFGKGPYEISEIANYLNKGVTEISPIRAKLIHKGFVYSTSHGKIDFTVPHFNRFLERI